MNYVYRILVSTSVLLAGCASYDGTYSPACMAFAGDTIRLSSGRFHWDKFTDQVIVGADGEVVDQFPAYPVQGKYRVDGMRLVLTSDTGKGLDDLYLLNEQKRVYLLQVQEYGEWQASGKTPECALVLGGHRSN